MSNKGQLSKIPKNKAQRPDIIVLKSNIESAAVGYGLIKIMRLP